MNYLHYSRAGNRICVVSLGGKHSIHWAIKWNFFFCILDFQAFWSFENLMPDFVSIELSNTVRYLVLLTSRTLGQAPPTVAVPKCLPSFKLTHGSGKKKIKWKIVWLQSQSLKYISTLFICDFSSVSKFVEMWKIGSSPVLVLNFSSNIDYIMSCKLPGCTKCLVNSLLTFFSYILACNDTKILARSIKVYWISENLVSVCEMSPVHTFVGHKDVVLEYQWKKQPEGKVFFFFI